MARAMHFWYILQSPPEESNMRNRPSKSNEPTVEAPRYLPWRVTGNQVYPAHDLRDHSLTKCWCNPTDDEGILVHHSLDGREHYESGERKPS